MHVLPAPAVAGDVRLGELATFGEGVHGGIGAIEFAADGSRVAYSTQESSGYNVVLADVASGKEVNRVKMKDRPSRVVISPDLTFAASYNEFDHWVNLWNVVESTAVAQLRPKRGSDDSYNGLTSPQFSPDGKFLYCVDSSYRDTPMCDLVQFESATGKELRRFSIHQPGDEGYGAPRMHLSVDGRRAFCVHPKGTVVWDVAAGSKVAAGAYAMDPEDNGSLVCPPTADGRAVVVSANGKFHVWHVDDNKLSPELDVKGVSFVMSVDARFVAHFGGPKHEILIFDTKSGRQSRKLSGHGNIIYGAAFTADLRRLISVAADGALKVWDLNSASEIKSFHPDTRGFEKLRVTPNGRLAATSDEGGYVRVWGLPASQ
jgi:WD40 repeat protein